jgi:Asp-tRNA(Asn)/Glu-tRNA(Gln) amidotransferase B subunit
MTDKPTYSYRELSEAYTKLQAEHVATTNNLQHLRQLCNEKNIKIARLQAELDAANLAMTRAAQVNGVGLKSANEKQK